MAATALSTSNIYEIAVSTAAEAMVSEVDRLTDIVSVVKSDPTVKALRVNTMAGVGVPTTWDGTSDLSAGTALGVAHTDNFTGQKYQLSIPITKDELITLTPAIVQTKTVEGIQRIFGYLQTLIATELSAGFTSTVHDGGVSTCAAISAAHLTRAGASRSNLLNDQLSAPALAVAIQRLMDWLDYEGQPLLPRLDGYTLVVDTRNVDLAHRLVYSQLTTAVGQAISGGSPIAIQNQINTLAQHGLRVKSYPFSIISGVDGDNWMLAPPGGFMDIGGQQTVNAPSSPLMLWWRYGPDLDIKGPENTANKSTIIQIDFECKIGWLPPNGRPLIGSDAN